MIDGDELGEVVAVTAKATFYKPDSYFQEAAWRTKYGIGGVGLINLVHEIGLMEYLFGPLLKIKSLTSNFVRLNLAEETIALCMEFKSGALGTMLVSDTVVSPYSWEMSVGENPAYPNYSFDCYEIMGTNASIGFPSMQLASYPGERNWWNDMSFSVIKKDISDPFERQFNHFCDVIEKKALPLISWYSALKAVEHISSVLKRDVDD
jgi:predicted dehydrogenase